mmetsp:Transcript_31904/g.95521  ORF Transcript_31904/g.95521 Transcript_31904/m.95521 type:complete len:337 (-) Transcript_31904:139-1149(-)
MHGHDLRRYNRLWQKVHYSPHNTVNPEWGHNRLRLAHIFQCKLDIFIRGGNREGLAHLRQLCGNIKWNLALNCDSLLRIFRVKGSGKCNNVALGSSILAKEWQCIHGRGRRDIHNSTPLSLNHTTDDEFCHPSRRIHIHFHKVCNFIISKFVKKSGVPVAHSNIVHEDTNIKAFDFVRDILSGLVIKLGIIANDVFCFHSIVSLFVDFFLEILQFRFSPADENDTHTLFSQSLGISLTNAISAPSYNCPFPKLLYILPGTKEISVERPENLQGECEEGKSPESSKDGKGIALTKRFENVAHGWQQNGAYSELWLIHCVCFSAVIQFFPVQSLLSIL